MTGINTVSLVCRGDHLHPTCGTPCVSWIRLAFEGSPKDWETLSREMPDIYVTAVIPNCNRLAGAEPHLRIGIGNAPCEGARRTRAQALRPRPWTAAGRRGRLALGMCTHSPARGSCAMARAARALAELRAGCDLTAVSGAWALMNLMPSVKMRNADFPASRTPTPKSRRPCP